MLSGKAKLTIVMVFIFLSLGGVVVSIFAFKPVAPSSGFTQKSFAPPEGKVLHIAGQFREEFDDYMENVTENGVACGLPGGAAFYTNLYLQGMTGPFINFPGNPHQDLPYLAKVYEPLTFQIALWLGSSQLKQIPNGTYDDGIRKLAENLKSYNRPIYFRIGYEFDGPHNEYEPWEYRAAYRYIVDSFREAGVTNVAYVWHSYASYPYQGYDVMDWYPGDDYVDWIGISFFVIEGNEYYRWRLLEIAKEKQTPLIICESSAWRHTSSLKELSGQAYWDYWYVPYFEFIENNPEVKAFSIINCNWDLTQQFGYLNLGDAMIAHDPVVLQNWREKMREERYLHSNPELYRQLGYG